MSIKCQKDIQVGGLCDAEGSLNGERENATHSANHNKCSIEGVTSNPIKLKIINDAKNVKDLQSDKDGIHNRGCVINVNENKRPRLRCIHTDAKDYESVDNVGENLLPTSGMRNDEWKKGVKFKLDICLTSESEDNDSIEWCKGVRFKYLTSGQNLDTSIEREYLTGHPSTGFKGGGRCRRWATY